jgi:hypothetical protein
VVWCGRKREGQPRAGKWDCHWSDAVCLVREPFLQRHRRKHHFGLRVGAFFPASCADVGDSPAKWCTSVLHFDTWRVIDQTDLRCLYDSVALMPNFGQVKRWFLEATPALSRYLTIPPSCELAARFCLSNSSGQFPFLQNHGEVIFAEWLGSSGATHALSETLLLGTHPPWDPRGLRPRPHGR